MCDGKYNPISCAGPGFSSVFVLFLSHELSIVERLVCGWGGVLVAYAHFPYLEIIF